MRWIQTGLGILAAAALASAASAQTVGIGATKAGAVSQITATISKAVSEHAPGVQMRKQTMGGTQQYIPVVNAGELEFGISNIPQFSMAFEGTGLSKGNKYTNLRLVSTIMKFRVSAVVPKKSGVTSMQSALASVQGRLFASPPQRRPHSDDIKRMPQVGWCSTGARHGAARWRSPRGLVRWTRPTAGPATVNVKAMHKWFPKSEWAVVQPAKGLTGVPEPTVFVSYDFLLWTHKGVSDDVVYKVAEVMHTQEKQLKEGGPLWRTFSADKRLAKQHGYPYHPAAVKYYKEVGLWPAG